MMRGIWQAICGNRRNGRGKKANIFYRKVGDIREAGRITEHGSALVYILIAIALLAALTISFMQPSSQQGQSQGSFKLVSELHSQADFIRSAVQECVLEYPGGDIHIQNGGGQEDEGADRRYPIKPNSLYYSSGATLGPAANRDVENIRCPGNPGDDVNHVKIFGGSSGKFMPPPPALFGNWQWYNGVDGVFFWIASDKSDAYIKTALIKLDSEFATCESDVIDNSGGGTDKDMDSDTPDQAVCPAGDRCFRVWMVTQPASAVFPDESATCP